MKKGLTLHPFLISLVLVFSACKSEFEKIRVSQDHELMYKKAMEYYEEGKYLEAQTLFELIVGSYRGRQEGEELFFKYAYTHYYLEEFILAAHYFKNFANTFINSDDREEADFMAAYANYKQSPGYRLDQGHTQKAIEGLQTFINTYPHSSRVEECNQLIDELRAKLELKVFEQGKLYYNLTDYQSATRTFENLLSEFPDTKKGEEVRYLMIKSSFDLAKNSVYEKRRERYESTLSKIDDFKRRYDRSKHRKELNEIAKSSRDEIKLF